MKREVGDNLQGNYVVYIGKDIYALTTEGHPLLLKKYRFTATKDKLYARKRAQPPMEACSPNVLSFDDAYIFVIGGTRTKGLFNNKPPVSFGCYYGFENCDCDDIRRDRLAQKFLTDPNYVDYYDVVKDVWRSAPALKAPRDGHTSCALKDCIYTFLFTSYKQNEKVKRLNARAVVDRRADIEWEEFTVKHYGHHWRIGVLVVPYSSTELILLG